VLRALRSVSDFFFLRNDFSSLSSSLLVRSDNPIHFNHQLHTSLTNDNYLVWKSQILPVLRGYDFMCYIDGIILPLATLPASSDGVIPMNPAFQQWHRQDQLILVWLFNFISPSIPAQVINCETSVCLWQQFHQLHTSQSLTHVLELKLQLQTSKKGGSTCRQYLQHMQSIADCLRNIGSDISEQDLILYTLQGLGSDFDNFVTAVSMRSGSLTMVELHNLLLSHEARLKANLHSLSSVHLASSQEASSTVPATALYIGTSQSRPPFSNFSSESSSQSFHTKGRGNQRGRGRGRFFGYSSDKPQRQICLRRGHTAAKYYHRFDLSFTGSTSSSPSPVSQPPQALLAEPSGSPTTAWFLNSGATTHVTSYLNNISSSSQYTGTKEVHIGNGSGLSISHIGSSCIGNIKLYNMLHVPDITKNPLSISQLTKDNNIIMEFTSSSCFVKDQATNQVLLHGTLVNGLY
jgi:gag-polypeptide of LTR copia-type